VSPAELVDAVRSHAASDRFATDSGGAIAVAIGGAGPPVALTAGPLRSLPFVIVGLGAGAPDPRWLPLVDVIVEPASDELRAIERSVTECPRASTALALLLRGSDGRSVADGLVAESATYALLQGGPEFARWRAATARRPDHDLGSDRVRVQREGDRLTITLARPARRNAVDAAMRDELCEALTLVALDPSITQVELAGEGPDFCAGGDLDEFGDRPDPATAHLVRLHRSPARLLAAIAPKVTARLHGACLGSGLELPAFGRRVIATPDVRLGLPEIRLGLVPGAGGTVSIPARIGRHRTAWLALTGHTIDGPTALAWGLIDEIDETDLTKQPRPERAGHGR